ncbi:MAG: hypothetical protein AABY27_01845, partial [Pseudomonadota bacterium]
RVETDFSADGNLDIIDIYDLNGNLIRKEINWHGFGPINSFYTYDLNYKIIKSEYDDDNNGSIDSAFHNSYDPISGRLIKSEYDNNNDTIIDSTHTHDLDSNLVHLETGGYSLGLVLNPEENHLKQLELLREHTKLSIGMDIKDDVFVIKGNYALAIYAGEGGIGMRADRFNESFLHTRAIFVHELAHKKYYHHNLDFTGRMEEIFLSMNKKLNEIALKVKNTEVLLDDEKIISGIKEQWNSFRSGVINDGADYTHQAYYLDKNSDGVADSNAYFTFDLDGILIKLVYDLGWDSIIDSVSFYAFDADGNPIKLEDSNNDGTTDATIKYTFDSEGNAIKENVITGTNPTDTTTGGGTGGGGCDSSGCGLGLTENSSTTDVANSVSVSVSDNVVNTEIIPADVTNTEVVNTEVANTETVPVDTEIIISNSDVQNTENQNINITTTNEIQNTNTTPTITETQNVVVENLVSSTENPVISTE